MAPLFIFYTVCYNQKMQSKSITIDGEVYDIPTRQAVAVSSAISTIWKDLGRPRDPFCESGKKLMKVIIATWEDTYPELSKRWYEDRKETINSQMTAREQVHQHTGRNLASYPMYIYQIMKKVFPTVKLSDRKTCLKMVKHYPMFRLVEKA